jgi:hypothetical protein
MSSGTLLWILLPVGLLLMVFMHRGHGGHGGHGSHGDGHDGPATVPADPRTKAGDDSAGHGGHGAGEATPAGQGTSEQDSGGHRHRGC